MSSMYIFALMRCLRGRPRGFFSGASFTLAHKESRISSTNSMSFGSASSVGMVLSSGDVVVCTNSLGVILPTEPSLVVFGRYRSYEFPYRSVSHDQNFSIQIMKLFRAIFIPILCSYLSRIRLPAHARVQNRKRCAVQFLKQ